MQHDYGCAIAFSGRVEMFEADVVLHTGLGGIVDPGIDVGGDLAEGRPGFSELRSLARPGLNWPSGL